MKINGKYQAGGIVPGPGFTPADALRILRPSEQLIKRTDLEKLRARIRENKNGTN